jgi:hypothetical protein
MSLPWTQIWQIWHKRQMTKLKRVWEGGTGMDPQAASSSRHTYSSGSNVPTWLTMAHAMETHSSWIVGFSGVDQGLGSQPPPGGHPSRSRRREQTLRDGARERWASAAGSPGQKHPAALEDLGELRREACPRCCGW